MSVTLPSFSSLFAAPSLSVDKKNASCAISSTGIRQRAQRFFVYFFVSRRGRGSWVVCLLAAPRYLSSLSCGRGLVLVGDKGYVREEEMAGQRDPHIAYHGSLSCMVSHPAHGEAAGAYR